MNTVKVPEKKGLHDTDIVSLRTTYGYNEVPIIRESMLLMYLKNFWGPLPWLMELLIIISFYSGQQVEGAIIALLLVINSLVSLFQRRSADAALVLLMEKLNTSARVFRNEVWGSVPVRELLPGDVIRIRVGDIIPADARMIDGMLSVDLSSLTGESLPKDVSASQDLFSGSIVRRGEATAQVTAIGTHTAYGKVTELLETSHPPTHMERIIFGIIKYFFFINLFLAVIITIFGIVVHAQSSQIINFVIVLLLTSVPISSPTMFAVAQSYGALTLSDSQEKGVLVHRLAAVQECAMVDVLCSDKTGTLTQNKLEVVRTTSYGASTVQDVLALASAASDAANADTIDTAILRYTDSRGISVPPHSHFLPFDPSTKRTEVDAAYNATSLHIVKGLPDIVLAEGTAYAAQAKADVQEMSADGLRVVAVVAKDAAADTCIGLIALADPIRPDVPTMIQELRDLGVRVIMITGDGRATAQAVARQLGLTGTVVTAEELRQNSSCATESSVFAEAYPEDKLTIIRALQETGHTVAMTGDGVNDAPALRQAEVGVAVSGATDVAKQSASFILTAPGLEGVIRTVKISRSVYARIRGWALNKIVKSFEVSVFTTVIFFMTHSYILSPLLAVLLIFANDFVTISMATDNTYHVERPAQWRIGDLICASGILALVPLLCLAFVYTSAVYAGYSIDVIRTITYLAMIFTGKSTLYAIRSWPHAWHTAPSRTLVGATAFSCLFALTISLVGFLIAPMPPVFLWIILIATIANFFGIDALKQLRSIQYLLGMSTSSVLQEK